MDKTEMLVKQLDVLTEGLVTLWMALTVLAKVVGNWVHGTAEMLAGVPSVYAHLQHLTDG